MDYRIDFEARDLLYFGDGLLADGSTAGSGVNWPLPSVINSALIAAMHNGLEEDVNGTISKHEHLNDYEKKKQAKGISVRFSFGGVQTVGPFPVIDDKMFVPIPADIQAGKNGELAIMRVIENKGFNNLPAPLTHLVAPSLPPSKETPGNWISIDELQKYLNGDPKVEALDNSDFYAVERRVGIGINPETFSTIKGKFYQAEYMRLNNNVALRVYAKYIASSYGGKNQKDMMAEAMNKNTFEDIALGGQAGVVFQKEMRHEVLQGEQRMQTTAFTTVKPTCLLKWILLTPAVFLSGWLPGFIDATNGKVHLKHDPPPKGSMPRDKWRELVRQTPEIDAKLVAARIPKHNVASGWKLNGLNAGQPKPTRRLVPAGSVFYFKCADDANAAALYNALNARSRSDECGEQGFGFGVCGNWNI